MPPTNTTSKRVISLDMIPSTRPSSNCMPYCSSRLTIQDWKITLWKSRPTALGQTPSKIPRRGRAGGYETDDTEHRLARETTTTPAALSCNYTNAFYGTTNKPRPDDFCMNSFNEPRTTYVCLLGISNCRPLLLVLLWDNLFESTGPHQLVWPTENK